MQRLNVVQDFPVGQEILQKNFSEAEFLEFNKRLKSETQLLSKWFDEGVFETGPTQIGLEIEGWLVDENHIASPVNAEFLKTLNHKLVVPELSKFNFEINSVPHHISSNVFTKIESELSDVWKACEKAASRVDAKPMAVGILPTLRDVMLTERYLSDLNRYYALNQEIFRLRKGKPICVSINGKENIELAHHDIMLEAATTSIQVHVKVNQDNAVRYYNASQILSAPMVAVAANSPYLFGHCLWEETRIPVFEQAVAIKSFRDKKGRDIGRVGFGTGYARESLLEPFLENLEAYPPLLPILSNDDRTWLAHLRLHNGTIWRWNRPIIGLSESGVPHLRIEHRVMSSGPSIVDMVANIAFFIGLISYFAQKEQAPESQVNFETAQKNFYEASRHGFAAEIDWFEGKKSNLQEILLNELIPISKQELSKLGVGKEDIETYIDHIILPRVMSGRTGSEWQRAFIDMHGSDFQAMSKAYAENFNLHQPVHEWTV